VGFLFIGSIKQGLLFFFLWFFLQQPLGFMFLMVKNSSEVLFCSEEQPRLWYA
jgi:hypothetical protein